MSEFAEMRPDPPLLSCLHCKWYTPKRHFCCKNLQNPIRKPLNQACSRFTISEDAKRAWSTTPANEMERWAQDRIREKLRRIAYP